MSLVVSHVGYDFVTVGADRGSWRTSSDGVPRQKPDVMARSKMHQVPGVPIIIATVGAWYEGWIETWIAEHPLEGKTYSLPDYARAFVADYWALHDPHARARLSECGMSLPSDGELKPNTPERLAASAQVIIAGLQPGWPRAQLWNADYPKDVEPLHYEVVIDEQGARRVEKATLHTMGQFDPLRPFIERIDADMTQEQSVEIVRSLLDVRERLGRTENPIPCLAPFDIVSVTKDGVEWIEGCEGPIAASRVVAFDAKGNVFTTKMFNANTPNATAWYTDFTIQTNTTGTSGTATTTYWFDNGSGVDITIHVPSYANSVGDMNIVPGSNGNAGPGHTTSASPSGTVTNVTFGQTIYFLAYYHPVNGWSITAQKNTPFTMAQIQTAYSDTYGYAIIASTVASSSGVTINGTGSGSFAGDGGAGGRPIK